MTRPSVLRPLSLLGAIVVGASVLTPIRALSDALAPEAPSSEFVAKTPPPGGVPIVTGTLRLIEVTDAVARLSWEEQAAKFLRSSEHLARDAEAADAMRAELVREHLRFAQGPSSVLDLDRIEQDFAAERAQVRAERREITEEEHDLTAARCEAQEAGRTSFSLRADTEFSGRHGAVHSVGSVEAEVQTWLAQRIGGSPQRLCESQRAGSIRNFRTLGTSL